MGLFDSVYVACPNCGSRNELQAKVRCEMGRFAGESVPADIAAGVNDDEFQCCGVQWKVKAPEIPRVALIVVRVNDQAEADDGDWNGDTFN